MDPNHLAVHDRLIMPEDIVGRSVLNSAGTMLYAISESGVMALPVGSLNKYNRIAASVEDALVSTNFCNRTAVTQSFTVTDPGGNHTDFAVSTSQTGVSISQSSGVTPATVRRERQTPPHSRAPAAPPRNTDDFFRQRSQSAQAGSPAIQ